MIKKSKTFSIYKNPQLYDDIMWWKKDDIAFFNQIIQKYNIKSVLELCCGTGRIGVPIIKSNIDYYGIDTSSNFIKFFNTKVQGYKNKNIKKANAKNFNLNQKFDLIIIGFNSLAHLLKDQEIQSCFQSVYNHMHENSLFIIDIFMPTNEITSNLNAEKIDLMDFKDSKNNQVIKIYESNKYNYITEVNTIKWDFYNDKNINIYSYKFDMRMLFPDIIHSLLAENKINVNQFYGYYDSSNFSENSEKQIYLCKK